MLDVRIDTVKIFTTHSTYHCEMHFGTTVAYRRVNLRCSTFASEVLHAVKIVVCFSPKETMMKHKPQSLEISKIKKKIRKLRKILVIYNK